MAEVKFEEIGRVRVSPTTEVVVSTVERPDAASDGSPEIVGISIGKYITTKGYTGFARDSVFIPNEQITKFARLVNSIVGG